MSEAAARSTGFARKRSAPLPADTREEFEEHAPRLPGLSVPPLEFNRAAHAEAWRLPPIFCVGPQAAAGQIDAELRSSRLLQGQILSSVYLPPMRGKATAPTVELSRQEPDLTDCGQRHFLMSSAPVRYKPMELTATLAPSFGSEQQPITFISGPKKNARLPSAATNILSAWLEKHRDRPYPSVEEKNRLTAESGLSELQVNHWFSNARRRKIRAPSSSKLKPASRPATGRVRPAAEPRQQNSDATQLHPPPHPPLAAAAEPLMTRPGEIRPLLDAMASESQQQPFRQTPIMKDPPL